MSVTLVKTIAEVRDRVAQARAFGNMIGFVPTMGALHAGHTRLMDQAARETGWTAVSIFVNPLQFGPNEDFTRYPRNLEADLEMCAKHGVELVFAPDVEEMYPSKPLTTVDVARVGEHLCGAYRPGHFQGVATVVIKLLNIVQPDKVYFGEKDAQQLAVIRRMVADLNVHVTVIEAPTVREPDGLAVSSRNRYLQPEERKAAPVLYRTLELVRKRVKEGARDVEAIKKEGLTLLSTEPLVRVEYLEIVDAQMQPVSEIIPPVRVLGAIWIGSTRLIDNLLC
ncbi:MAG: pantoate--beta-alanine ligase [Acidobacteria bacterium]|nr:pantoate--beta-alanine ligase [Acidobacteriota bacterium]